MESSREPKLATRRDALDAIIVGGGAVALTAALALSYAPENGKTALKCALVQKQAPEPLRAELDPRVYALAPDVLAELTQLGVILASARTHPYQHMRVWDANSGLEFNAAEYGWHALGEIVEHRVLIDALWQALKRSTVRILEANASLSFDARGALIDTPNETLRAELIIAADGAHSPLRLAAGIKSTAHDYQQTALVLNVKTDAPQPLTCAWQRFYADTTLAFLPLPNGVFNVVWSLPSPAAERMMALPDAAFLAELQSASMGRAGQLSAPGLRQSAPLQRMLAERYVQNGVVLVGDSAHCVHPMAGQGLNMGLRDSFTLARHLQNNASKAERQRALRRYERERRSENSISTYGIETLQSLFTPDKGPIALARRLGLQAVNQITPIKRLFAELAAGKIAGWP
jgi:ubiquinone biosynthesis UbiH/UbiF/VisC/COQ6 family hydroxylase